MKADYNSLLYAYESNNIEIINIISDEFDIAMEADDRKPDEINSSKVVSDTVKSDEEKSINKTKLINKVIERVKNLIRKIGEMFDALKRKLLNRLRLLSESDKGFYKLYMNKKSMIKPHANVKVISYQYNNQILDRPFEKIMNEIIICLDKLRAIEGTINTSSRISEIINSQQGKIIEVLLSPYVDNSDEQVTSINQFIKYIVTKYRGEKKEILYHDTDLPKIEANALSTNTISDKCNAYVRKAQEAYNKIKILEYKVSRNTEDEKVIKLVAANAAKAASLYNAYSALVNAYYELKLEQSLNYRIILRKFYSF